MQSENKLQKNSSAKDEVVEEEENEEVIEISSKQTLYEKVYELAEKFAGTKIGQYVIEKADKTLKVIEDTAKWSLPQTSDKSEEKLERPLPWLPFLSLIVTLRLLRVWLSLGSLMIGNSPISANDVVYFLQTRRRKLRTVRVHGAKAIRRRERETQAYRTSLGNGKGLMDKLRKLMSRAICRPGQHNDMERRIFVKKSGNPEETTSSERQASKRPRDDEASCNDHNLTTDQMLSKYANQDSEDDSDFIPNPEDESSSEGTSSSSSSASEDNENDENPSDEEKNVSVEIQNGEEGKSMPKPIRNIKSEPISESESPTLPKTFSNGLDKNPNEAANKPQQNSGTGASMHSANKNHKMNGGVGHSANGHEEKSKPSNGPDSAAFNKPMHSNPIAMTGSPTDFNSCFPSKIQANETNEMNSHSTPKSSEEVPEASNESTLHKNNPQHHFYPSNRHHRGRNHRRHY